MLFTFPRPPVKPLAARPYRAAGAMTCSIDRLIRVIWRRPSSRFSQSLSDAFPDSTFPSSFLLTLVSSSRSASMCSIADCMLWCRLLNDRPPSFYFV